MKRTKISAFLVSIALVCAIFALTALGADDGQLSVNAAISGKNINITLQNKSQNYLGNIKVSVKAPDGTVLDLSEDGVLAKTSGNAADTLRELAPSGTQKFSAGLGKYAPVTETTPPPVVTEERPVTVVTTANATEAPPAIIPPVQTEAPVTEAPATEADTEADTDTDTSAVTEDTETSAVTEVSDTEAETDTDTEVITGVTTETDTDTDVAVTTGESENDEKGGTPVGLIIGIVAAVVAVGAGVVVLVVFKKKRGVSSVIVLAVLLSGLGAAGGLDADAAVTVETVEEKVSTDSGIYTVTVKYKSVPAAVTNALKNNRRAPSTDVCNTPQVNQNRITEGAGPLTTSGIYVGKNDLMFNGDEIKMYRGETARISTARLEKLSDMMTDRDAWAKENGIKLYFVICPNKCTVYSDYVPESLKKAEKNLTDMVVEHLAENSTVEVIDLRDPLIDARAIYGDDLYYNYDTHWNNNGGFVGYSEIIRQIGADFPGVITLEKNDFQISEYETYMKDMAYYLGYYSTYQDFGPVYTLKSGMTATIGKTINDGYWGQFVYCSRWKDGYSDALKYVEYENEYNEDAPNLYMYRDSYSLALIHFLKDSFNKSVFNWSFEFDRDAILKSGADVVIIEVVERSIPDIIASRTFN